MQYKGLLLRPDPGPPHARASRTRPSHLSPLGRTPHHCNNFFSSLWFFDFFSFYLSGRSIIGPKILGLLRKCCGLVGWEKPKESSVPVKVSMEKGFLVFDFALSGPVWKGDRYALFGFLENEAEDYVYLTCRLIGGSPIRRGICMDVFRGYFTR